MTQQTKPTAGALGAARKSAERTLRTLQGWDEQTWVDIAADIIDRETGVAELLATAKQVMADLSDEEVPDADTVEMLEHAIAKVEGEPSNEHSE